MNETIEAILNSQVFGVVGASANHDKFGYKVWRSLQAHGKTAYPINPTTTAIEGEPAYPTLADLPVVPEAVAAIVPPSVTESLPAQLAALGIRYLWLQPGAESSRAVEEATRLGIAVVYGGPCLLVELRKRDLAR